MKRKWIKKTIKKQIIKNNYKKQWKNIVFPFPFRRSILIMWSHINVHNCGKERNYIKNDRKHDQGHTSFLLERMNSKAGGIFNEVYNRRQRSSTVESRVYGQRLHRLKNPSHAKNDWRARPNVRLAEIKFWIFFVLHKIFISETEMNFKYMK
jgi:hypothetical protein